MLCVIDVTLLGNDDGTTDCFRSGTSDAGGGVCFCCFGVGSVSHGLSLPQPGNFGFGHSRHCTGKSGITVSGGVKAARISAVVIGHLRGAGEIVGFEQNQRPVLEPRRRSARGRHGARDVVLLQPLANVTQAAVAHPRVAVQLDAVQTRQRRDHLRLHLRQLVATQTQMGQLIQTLSIFIKQINFNHYYINSFI